MVRQSPPRRVCVLASLGLASALVLASCTDLVQQPLTARTPVTPPAAPVEQAAGAQAQGPPQPTTVDGVEHTVVEGDTLWSIAERYGVTLESLTAANPDLPDPDALQVGEVVVVPVAPEPTAAPESGEQTTVAQEGGDGLPDLVVTIPPVVVDGRLVLNVKNQGGAPLGKTVIRVAVREDDRTLVTTSVTVDELRPGASVDVPTNLAVAGYRRLTAVVDPDALIEESVEDNNAVLLDFGE